MSPWTALLTLDHNNPDEFPEGDRKDEELEPEPKRERPRNNTANNLQSLAKRSRFG